MNFEINNLRADPVGINKYNKIIDWLKNLINIKTLILYLDDDRYN